MSLVYYSKDSPEFCEILTEYFFVMCDSPFCVLSFVRGVFKHGSDVLAMLLDKSSHLDLSFLFKDRGIPLLEGQVKMIAVTLSLSMIPASGVCSEASSFICLEARSYVG